MSQQGVIRAAGLLVYRLRDAAIEYLLLQASYAPHHWTPPKGHLDPGEDERTAALRETEEEAGLTVNKLIVHEDFHHEMSYTVTKDSSTGGGGKTARPKIVTYWLAKLKDDGEADETSVRLSNEHQDYVWVPLEDAIKKAGFPEMEKLLRSAEVYLKGL